MLEDKLIEIEEKIFLDDADYDGIVKELDAIIEQDPSNKRALELKYFAFFANEKYEECITACDKVIELDSENVDALNFKASSLLQIDKTDECIKVCDILLKVDPYNMDAKELKERSETMKTLLELSLFNESSEALEFEDPIPDNQVNPPAKEEKTAEPAPSLEVPTIETAPEFTIESEGSEEPEFVEEPEYIDEPEFIENSENGEEPEYLIDIDSEEEPTLVIDSDVPEEKKPAAAPEPPITPKPPVKPTPTVRPNPPIKPTPPTAPKTPAKPIPVPPQKPAAPAIPKQTQQIKEQVKAQATARAKAQVQTPPKEKSEIPAVTGKKKRKKNLVIRFIIYFILPLALIFYFQPTSETMKCSGDAYSCKIEHTFLGNIKWNEEINLSPEVIISEKSTHIPLKVYEKHNTYPIYTTDNGQQKSPFIYYAFSSSDITANEEFLRRETDKLQKYINDPKLGYYLSSRAGSYDITLIVIVYLLLALILFIKDAIDYSRDD
ncbi:hypothetical protein IKP85_06910 [bacterium]|nr:hypothetical protein [bacterium]